MYFCSLLLTDVRYSSYPMAVGDRLLMVGLLGAYLVSLCSYYKGGSTRILIAHSYYLWANLARVQRRSATVGGLPSGHPRAWPLSLPQYGWYTNRAGTGACPYERASL